MRSLKICLIIVLLISMSILGAGCKFNWLTGPSDPNDNGDDEECEYPLEPAMGNVGDTIRSCHFEAIFEWAQRTDTYKEARPRNRDANTLVVFYVKVKLIKSNGTLPSIFCYDFTIEDNQGNRYGWDGLTADDVMNQGSSVEGTCVIEVPKTASGFTAIFQTQGYPDKIKCSLGF